MSSIGFPDGQRITQWLGAPIVSQVGLVIGNVLHEDGPFNLASWASVVVAIKPTGGNVTVTVRQRISGGPAGLELPTSFIVPAGQTFFESVVLLGDAVYIDLTGSAPGVSVDYAVYPSNTTTNAQVLASATINVQKNEVLVAAEATLDFVDADGFPWTVTDDPGNTRVKVTPPQRAWTKIGSVLVPGGGASSITFANIPQTYSHLVLKLFGKSLRVGTFDGIGLRFNGDNTANYDYEEGTISAATAVGSEAFASTSGGCMTMTGTAVAAIGGVSTVDIPGYTDATIAKEWAALSFAKSGIASGNLRVEPYGGAWRNVAAITQIDLVSLNGASLAAGFLASLYALR